MSNCIVVYCTVPTKNDAKSIAKILLTQRLAACINIVEKVQSIFSWHDEICEEKELLMMIKTKRILFDKVKTAIKNAFGQLSVHKIFQTGQRCFKHLLNLQKQILETPIDTIDTLYPQINENMLFHSFYIQVIKNLHSITDNDGINV